MTTISTLQLNLQGQSDIQRIRRDLADAQAQISSGTRAKDLVGFGAGASRIVSARQAIGEGEARIAQTQEIEARLDVQAIALERARTAVGSLNDAIGVALINSDGRYLNSAFENAFSAGVAALNEAWGGAPLFAGEREGERPVQLGQPSDLLGNSPVTFFEEASRRRSVDIGATAPVDLAPKASEIGLEFVTALQRVQTLLSVGGGSLPHPLTDAQVAELTVAQGELTAAATKILNAEAATGELATRMAQLREKEQKRIDVVNAGLGRERDADLAELATRIANLDTQYRATAQSFAQLSRLTLLDYLR